MRVEYLNSNGCLGIFRIMFFAFFLFSISFTSAQQTANSTKSEQATVVLKNGATIFSKDESFNKQINNQVVLLKNADIVQNDKKQNELLEASSSQPAVLKKDLKQELKTATEKKQKAELKKVKKEIDQHEVRKKAFKFNNFKGLPSSEEFFASKRSNKDSIAPAYNKYDLSKIIFAKDYSSVKTALYFLHSKKYAFYNSNSLGLFISEIFSVRPPPSTI